MDSIKILLAVILMCTIAGNFFTGAQTLKSSLIFGYYLYEIDIEEARSREDAMMYCREQGGELAKIWNREIYNLLRNLAPVQRSYWVDGIDRQDHYRFDFSRTCSHRGEHLDLSGIPAGNLDFPQVSCMSLVKGTTQRNSKLESANCSEERFVICQYPLGGCDETDFLGGPTFP